MIDKNLYICRFRSAAAKTDLTPEEIECSISYAQRLLGNGVPVIFDQIHLSKMLGVDYDYLLALTNVSGAFYKEFHLPKKHGGYRTIKEPYPDLKEIQAWILKNILNPIVNQCVSPVAKAFVPSRSIRENARFHRGKNVVVAFDVEDFFGSIKEVLVYKFFHQIGYTKSVSMLMAKLCSLDGVLPQGSPTSPMLSNMIFKPLDDEIWNYCKLRNICYTRYADDLTFSGENIDIAHLKIYVEFMLRRIELRMNEKKTKVMGRGTRQNVTGAVVNDVVQARRAYRDKIRQEMYYCVKFGVSSHMQRCPSKPQWIKTEQNYIHHLLGKVNFVLQLNPRDQEMQKYANWLKEEDKKYS